MPGSYTRHRGGLRQESPGKEMALSGTSWSSPGQEPLPGRRGAWSLSPCGCCLHTSGWSAVAVSGVEYILPASPGRTEPVQSSLLWERAAEMQVRRRSRVSAASDLCCVSCKAELSASPLWGAVTPVHALMDASCHG